MSDPFRNELETVLERSAKLEAENAELRASVEALKHPTRAPGSRLGPVVAATLAIVVAAGGAVGYVLMRPAASPGPTGFNGVAISPPSDQGGGTPRCATQDCATGKIIDNGCTPDGRCASCVNFCGPPSPPPAPTAASPGSDGGKCACAAGDPLCNCAGPAATCNPPYTIDAQGNKVFKKECF